MGFDLSLIWAVLILFGIMMYVVMDGFDLGIGLLYPFFSDKTDRDVMMNTVAPVWDGNETWLVLGGGNGLQVQVTGRPLAARAGEPMHAIVSVASAPIASDAWQRRLASP